MIRSPLKPPPWPEKPDRSSEFASFTAKPRRAVMARNLDTLQIRRVTPKLQGRKRQAIRDSAGSRASSPR